MKLTIVLPVFMLLGASLLGAPVTLPSTPSITGSIPENVSAVLANQIIKMIF